jgi:Uma2 family endonuclease
MSTFDRLSDLAPERVRPLKRVEFEKLVSLGHLIDEPVELLGGAIVEMSPQGTRHAAALGNLTMALGRVVGEGITIRVQMPFAAGDESLPEPDLAVVPNGDYRDAHPTRALLLVEVSDTSLRKDRLVKGPLYAQAGVPEYWIVNLAENRVEVHAHPLGGVYSTVTIFEAAAATVELTALPGASVNVADIFG